MTPPGASGFVGRSSELARLRAALPDDDEVGTRLAFITGEAGIGKSRLATETARHAASAGHQVVWSQVWQEASAPPFWPWTQIVRQLTNDVESVDLAALVLDDADAIDRFELFDATAEVLRKAAEQLPLVVIIDDLHDADPPSILLLHFVAAHLSTSPLLIICTYRDQEMAARPEIAELLAATDRLSVTLHLEGLDVGEVAAMAADPTTAAHLHAATGGNPLFLEQVLRGGADDTGDQPTVGADALHDVLVRRMERLAPETRQVLAARSVLGPDLHIDDVAALSTMDSRRARSLLEAAAGADLLDRDQLWFTHPLIAAAALDLVSTAELHALHLGAVQLLKTRPGSIADQAHHLMQAGPEHWEAAVAACRAAAAHATAVHAYEDAVTHLRRAHRLVESNDATPRLRFDATFELAGAVMTASGRPTAEELYLEAWELAQRTGDADLIAVAAARHTIQFFFGGDVNEEPGRQVRAALDQLPDERTAIGVRLYANLAAALVGSHPDEAQIHAATAVEIGRAVGDPAALGNALVAEQINDLGPASLRRRLDTAREIVALAESISDHDLVVHGRFLLMAALLERGDVGELDAQLRAQDHVVDTIASPRFARHALWFRVMRAMLDGDADQVITLAEECYTIAEKLEDPDGIGVFWGQVGIARWMQGRVLEMEPAYLEQSRVEPDAPLWKAVLAWLWAKHGELAAARGALDQLPPVHEIPEGQHTLLTLVTMADAACIVDDSDRAAELWEALLPYADRVVPVAMGAATWGTVARPLGLLALHLGRVEEGIAHLEHAISVCARLGARPWLAEAQLDLAETLLDHGRGDDPRIGDAVNEAASIVRRRGLAVFDERVRTLSARLGRGEAPVEATVQPEAAPASGRARIDVLGTFEVTAVDGSSPRWTSRKARELLKILVARRGAPVPREVLMDLLWPDEDPAKLSNRLSVALSTIRRALDPDRTLPTNSLISAESGVLRLMLSEVDVDAEEFLSAAELGIDAHRNRDASARAKLTEARNTFGGHALPDEPYSPWAVSLRDEVTAALITVLRCSAEQAATAGDELAASEAFRGLLDADPFDEAAHLGLIRSLLELGAHGQADAANERYVQAMAEIGVPVSDDPSERRPPAHRHQTG